MSLPSAEELGHMTGTDVLGVIRRLVGDELNAVEREIETLAMNEAAHGNIAKRDGLYRAVGVVAKHRKELGL